MKIHVAFPYFHPMTDVNNFAPDSARLHVQIQLQPLSAINIRTNVLKKIDQLLVHPAFPLRVPANFASRPYHIKNIEYTHCFFSRGNNQDKD